MEATHVAQEEEALMMLRAMVQSNSSPTPAVGIDGGGDVVAGGWIRGPVGPLVVTGE
jgi:hypothetical protein